MNAGAVTTSTAIDSSYVEAQRAVFGAKGGVRHKRSVARAAAGRPRSHALADIIGRTYALLLTPGNVSDMKAAPGLLKRAGRMNYLIGDKGYVAGRLRSLSRDAGTAPVIPGHRNRKRPIRYDRQRYAGRDLIENAFCRLEDFRRVHARYGKLAANFLSAVALVSAVAVAFWL